MSRSHWEQARAIYADAVAGQGPAWSNTAANVRGGFENVWIKPALDAIEATLKGFARAEDDAEENRP